MLTITKNSKTDLNINPSITQNSNETPNLWD